MIKALKFLIITFSSLTLIGLIWLAWDTVGALNQFVLISFSAVAAYSFFVLWLYIRLSNIGMLVNSVVSFLILLPLLIHFIALWSPSTLEKSWPLLMSMLIFQSGVGMLSLLGLFQRNRTKSVLAGITGLLITLFSVTFMISVLLKLDMQLLYTFFTGGVAVISVLFLVVLFLAKSDR